jgi:outer membrane protein OmpA-like peptidoglycan-associated protein
LAKVKGIAQDLNPTQVVVEGHTDATGGPAVNQQISQDRAQAVATYFEENGIEGDKVQAVGKGYKKPIASNKTNKGRATNRRVDIIITPSGRSVQ